MVRTKINVTSTQVQVTVPDEYVGKQIEVLLYEIDEGTSGKEPTIDPSEKTLDEDLIGSLKLSPERMADLKKHIKEIRDEW